MSFIGFESCPVDGGNCDRIPFRAACRSAPFPRSIFDSQQHAWDFYERVSTQIMFGDGQLELHGLFLAAFKEIPKAWPFGRSHCCGINRFRHSQLLRISVTAKITKC